MIPTDTVFGGFGGHWSDVKLAAVREYFSAYNMALSQTSFTRVYIDGFAGGGRVKPAPQRKESANSPNENELFSATAEQVRSKELAAEDTEGEESENFRHGSPLLALEAEPPFHKFIFIERDSEVIAELQRQVTEAGTAKGRSVEYICEDANEALTRISRLNWRAQRATLFLDPFALHVRWETLQAIARTQAMDMWLLFPAMAVNRMLPRNAEVPETWAKRLDETFGDSSWRQAFYAKPEPPVIEDMFQDMLPTAKEEKLDDPFGRLSKYVTARLKTIFADAVDKPLILKTASGSPLFLLCFAVANERGAPIAKRIANHILNKQRHGL
jgi:three-Cys-motif partner protein